MNRLKLKHQGFNSPIKKSNGTPSTNSKHKRTTCLLCGNVVNLPPFIKKNNTTLQKLVTNFYKHLKIPTSQLPAQYTEQTLPFCEITCEPLLTQLWEQQTLLDETFDKIKSIISDVHQKVVGLTIIGNRSCSIAAANSGNLKFTKLTDLILEGYKQKLSENYDDLEETRQVQRDYQEDSIQLQMDEIISHSNYENSTGIECYDFLPISHPKTQESYENLNNEDESYDPTLFEEKFSWSLEPVADLSVNDSDEDSSWLITNKNDETFQGTSFDIRQERDHEVVLENDDEDVYNSTETLTLENKKRRFFYEGVEIYKVKGDGSCSNMKFLQCSLCSYNYPLPKSRRRKGPSLAYFTLKTHILHDHRKKQGLPKVRRAPQISCIPCNKTFSNMKELWKHNVQHPEGFRLVCDICGKPFAKGTPALNLPLHKFSHKNAEERRQAIQAGERGAYSPRRSSKVRDIAAPPDAKKRGPTKNIYSGKKKASESRH